MTSVAVLGERQIDALREIGDIGAGTAARAPSRMTGAPVHIGIPRVGLLPVERVADELATGRPWSPRCCRPRWATPPATCSR